MESRNADATTVNLPASHNGADTIRLGLKQDNRDSLASTVVL
jgi:hypothetical protein